MKHTRLLVLLLCFGIFLTGCQTTGEKPANDPPATNGQQVQQPESQLVPAGDDPKKTERWTMLSEVYVDLNLDGKEEHLGLFTTAERDKKGNMMWDDGQKWLLVVQDEQKFYPLFSEYVQLGSVYFNVAAYGEKEPPKVTVIVSTGSDLKLTNYSYAKDKDGYQEEPLYDSKAINRIFTSLPEYK
ncbi:MAG: hypothetical protein PHU78_06105 [Heliobacteriaceae bacterium]|nr:hypothetical protein [Heliobacteriaceae bacterium]